MKVYNVCKGNQMSMKVRVTFNTAISLQLCVFAFLSSVISIFFAKR